MKPNSILALAMACAATNPLLMRDLERMQPRPVKPQTKADADRLAAAQAKRERKARQKLKATSQLNAFENRKIAERLEAGGGHFYGDDVIYQRPQMLGLPNP
jgi:hypothetical protein